MRRLLPADEGVDLRSALLRLIDHGQARDNKWRALRTRVVLGYAQSIARMGVSELAMRAIYKARGHSGLHEKWLTGKVALSRVSAAKLDSLAPGTLELFDLPLFPLLSDSPVREADVFDLLSKYRRAEVGLGDLMPWKFPDELQRLERRDFSPVMSVTDTANLFLYGTPHSFAVLLGVVRVAESRRDIELHVRASQDLYRALPFILRAPWFKESREDFIALLNQLRSRVLLSARLFDVDWDVVFRQESDLGISLCRWKRPRCPASGRFADLEDPILPAEIIPGVEARRRRVDAARRRATRK